MDFETRAIHAGQAPDPATGAVTTPIYQTSTFAQEAVGVHKGYDYARVANPTRTALEEWPRTATRFRLGSARRHRSCTSSTPGITSSA
jgi:cystathionine beta-lyase/cystathionine gamma-synthase